MDNNYNLIDNNQDLINLVPIIQKNNIVGLDIEASSLDPYTATLLLIQLSIGEEIYVINTGKVERRSLLYLVKLLKETNILCIGHNIKYDMKMIYHNFRVLLTNIFDTMLAEVLQKPGVAKPFNSYAFVVKKYMGIDLPKTTRDEFIGKTDFEFSEKQLLYAANDVRYLVPIMERQSKLLQANQGKKIWELEMRLEPVVAMMEYQGVLLNATRWKGLTGESERLAHEYSVKLQNYLAMHFDTIAGNYENALEAANNLYIPTKTKMRKAEREHLASVVTRDEILGAIIPLINMNSSKQSTNILQKLGIKTKTSNQKELTKFKGHEFIDLLFSMRRYFKAGHAFGDEFINAINPVSGRIHSNYEQAVAKSGRFAGRGPNLQNIKAETTYRSCFLARPGYLYFTADYSQIELRIMAEISREPLMIEAFQRGDDLHKLTASIIFNKPFDKVTSAERGKAKNVNFAVIYGITEYGLQRQLGWTLEQGKLYLDRYFNKYTTLAEFIKGAGSRVIREAYSITMYGRKRYFTLPRKLMRRDLFLIKKIQRQGVNHIVQGTAGDMLKLQLCYMFYKNPFDKDIERPENFRILQTTHDECAGEFREGKEEEVREFIGRCMEDAAKPFLHDVPVDYNIEIDKCWRKT